MPRISKCSTRPLQQCSRLSISKDWDASILSTFGGGPRVSLNAPDERCTCHSSRQGHHRKSQSFGPDPSLEHLHPAALKGFGNKPFDTALEKKVSRPLQSRGLDCQGSSNFRLHSLSSRVSVALAAPRFRDLIHL